MHKILLRDSAPPDFKVIATLHTQSWLNTYRGLLSDQYLDNDLQGERERYWSRKLNELTSREFVLIAEEDGIVVGFVSLPDKPEKGYEGFINNLHVSPGMKGHGIGTQLLKAVEERLVASGRKSYYLWVLKGNVNAENFYLSRGAEKLDKGISMFGGELVEETRLAWKIK